MYKGYIMKIKLYYVSNVDFSSSAMIGVANKIIAQSKAFNSYSIETKVFYLKGNTLLSNNEALEEYENNAKRRIKYYERIRREIEYDYSIENKNIIYLRFSYPHHYVVDFVDYFNAKNYLVFLEIPTYPYLSEWRGIKGSILRLNDFIYRRKLVDSVDSIITFSNVMNVFGKPTIVIQNGIEIRPFDTELRKKPDGSIVLIGVANVSYWHGYDRLILSLKDFYDHHPGGKVIFKIVGESPYIKILKKMVNHLGLYDYVKFTGCKSGVELDYLLYQSDIGVGSLGAFRKKIHSASELKLRYYCLMGLPFLLGVEDLDFPNTFPFAYRVPNDDSKIDLNGLLKWFDRLTVSHSDYILEMENYAKDHLSWKTKISPIIERISIPKEL